MFLLTDAAREAIVHPRCGALRAGYIRAAAALHRCPAEAAPMLPGVTFRYYARDCVCPLYFCILQYVVMSRTELRAVVKFGWLYESKCLIYILLVGFT